MLILYLKRVFDKTIEGFIRCIMLLDIFRLWIHHSRQVKVFLSL